MMTNTQLYLSIGLPTLLILMGLLLNFNSIRELKGEVHDLRGEIGDLRRETNSKFETVVSDLRQFFGITGELKGRLDELSKKR